jgi:hypothetical protein
MPESAVLESPWGFLCALAQRFHTTPERISSQRATEGLITWLEGLALVGRSIPRPFLRVAARLVYEQARLALPPNREDVFALAERLRTENRGRPQAATWEPRDWLKLGHLVLEKRRLPAAAFFGPEPPSPEEVILNVELPFAARYVEEALAPDARRLASPPWSVLLERAEELLIAAAGEVPAANGMLDGLRAAVASLTRRPASRSHSANPSHEFCESRNDSAN